MIMKPQEGREDIWAKLAAPLDPRDISWRIDSKPIQKNGKCYARFVCYVESNTIRSRLDSVVPGGWECSLELLPERPDSDGSVNPAFKARLHVLGVTRENVGSGKDVKTAATDAFKRAAVHFGIGSELYDFEQNWVEVDGDSKYAKPVEDPQLAYERRHGTGQSSHVSHPAVPAPGVNMPQAEEMYRKHAVQPHPIGTTSQPTETDDPSCPKCGGSMFDNRLTKRNPKAPDYKCKARSCQGVIWPPRSAKGNAMDPQDYDENAFPAALRDEDDDLPF